jgi:hypothetical protein
MTVRKRKNPGGSQSWGHVLDAIGSTKKSRRQISKWGFKTRTDALEAEAARRLELLAAHRGKPIEPIPSITLQMLLDRFFVEHCDSRLSPKTIERYHDCVAYLAPDLRSKPAKEITAVDLSREWNRLLASGGHCRKTGLPRPLGAKSIRTWLPCCQARLAREFFGGLFKLTRSRTASLQENLLQKPVL